MKNGVNCFWDRPRILLLLDVLEAILMRISPKQWLAAAIRWVSQWLSFLESLGANLLIMKNERLGWPGQETLSKNLESGAR